MEKISIWVGRFWKSAAALSIFLSILLIPKKLNELSATYPKWHEMMPSTETAALIFSGLCVLYII